MNGLEGPGRTIGIMTGTNEESNYRLKWNSFENTLTAAFERSFFTEEYVDVTLCAGGKSIKSHRVLLSACSSYLRKIFARVDSREHPVVFFPDTIFEDLHSLLTFVYHGEVILSDLDRLAAFVKLCETLEIKEVSNGLLAHGIKDNFTLNATCPDAIEMIKKFTAMKVAREMSLSSENVVNAKPKEAVPRLDLPIHMTRKSPSSPNRQATPPCQRNRLSPVSKIRETSLSDHKKSISPLPKKRKFTQSPHSPHRQQMTGRISPNGSSNHSASVVTSGYLPTERRIPQLNTVQSTNRETLRLLQCTPPQQIQRQVTPNSTQSEDDSCAINLSTNNGSVSPDKVYPKIEYDDANESGRENETEIVERPPAGIPDEESHVNSPSFLTQLAITPYDGYPAHMGVAGPSREMSTANPAAWRNDITMSEPPIPKGSHPVFNELFGEGASGRGKKAVPTPCPECGKVLSNAYNMRVHLETHMKISYKCIVCGIVTHTKDTMRKHCSNVHQLRNVEFKKSFKIISEKTGQPSPIAAKRQREKSSPLKLFNPFETLANLGGLLKPKKEPILTPPTIIPMDSGEAINLAKGSSLASIVSKLSQKQ